MLDMLNKLLSSRQNPNAMLQTLMSKNPQFSAILNQQKQSGMSMEQFTRQYAKQHNIDLQPMLDAMRKNGFK